MKKLVLPLVALLVTVAAAQAQSGRNYDVQSMNFDLWCQEQANLPAARCDKRTPDDEKTFEEYRATIERYEIPYLEQKRKDADLDRNVLHNDPTDTPKNRDPGTGATQPLNQPPRTPPP